MPMLAPRCFGSAAMVRVVSALIQEATSISDGFKDLYLDRMVVKGDYRFIAISPKGKQGLWHWHFNESKNEYDWAIKDEIEDQRPQWLIALQWSGAVLVAALAIVSASFKLALVIDSQMA